MVEISLTPNNLANPYLHWETNKNMEAGVNIDMLKGRINIDAMYYHNRVSDQLTEPVAGEYYRFQFVAHKFPG